MKQLNEISSSQYANDLMNKIDENFGDVKDAIDVLEQGGESGSTTIVTPKFINNPFPINNTELRVLCLGNSYTITPLMYLSELVNATNIDNTKFRIEATYIQGMTLETLLSRIENNDTKVGAYLMGGGTLGGATATSDYIRNKIVSAPWDIIVIQAQSNNSLDYNTFGVNLTKVVNIIRRYCTNQKVCIAWQQTWSKAANYDTNWGKINIAVKTMLANNGINYIIPTGTAIQNARNVFEKTLMGDVSGHLSPGVARYVGACTWFQALLAPIFNVSVVGNTATHDASNGNDTIAGFSNFEQIDQNYQDNSVGVTNENKLAAQLCALYAITDMWNVTEI